MGVSTEPKRRGGLELAQRVNYLFRYDEFQLCITYGGTLGIGKSSYDIQTLGEAYGNPETQTFNWRKVKPRIWHPPRQFCNYILKMRSRQKVGMWDDAGLWLFALDWRDPFVISVTKYLNVARTDWGMLILNTPHPRFIVKRIQIFPEVIYCKITKRGGGTIVRKDKTLRKPRIATAYRQWELPDMKKTGVKKLWVDPFNAIMPNEIYKWYKPIRDRYARIAKILMLLQLKRIDLKQKRKWLEDQSLENDVAKVLPQEEEIKDLQELIQQHTVSGDNMNAIEEAILRTLQPTEKPPRRQLKQIDKGLAKATKELHGETEPLNT